MKISPFFLGSLALALSAVTASATNYAGNGGTGFGGNVGLGSLSVTSNLTNNTYTFSFSTGNAKTTFDGANSFVLYLDTAPGGFTSTTTFTDSADNGRSAISGYNNNGGNPSRALVNFASGFGAEFGISFEDGYIGMFGLAAGGNNSLNYVTGIAPNPDASPFTLTVTAAQLGLTSANSILNFVGTYTSTAAYRSNEAVGTAFDNTNDGNVPLPSENPSTNPGFNSIVTFGNYLTYNPAAVPEPGTVACFGLGAAALALGWRRRALRA